MKLPTPVINPLTDEAPLYLDLINPLTDDLHLDLTNPLTDEEAKSLMLPTPG